MPFKSEKQRRWMYANKPEIAKKWQAEYHQEGGLLDGLQTPTINNAEDLQQAINARNAELANVSREIGVDPTTLDQRIATAQDINQLGQDTWGAGAALRKGTAAENAGQMAEVLAELARQNPNWGGAQAEANRVANQVQPAQQQGFWSWAGEQAGDALGAAGDAAGSAFNTVQEAVTGEGARAAEAEAYQQSLENMTPEQLLERLNQRTLQNQQPAPEDVRGQSIWDRAKGAVSALNPISDANASSRQAALGAAAASLPNPHLGSAGFGTALAGAEGALGAGGSGGVAPTRNEALQFDLGRAQDADPRRVYNKGFFGGGSWGQETPEQIAQRQQEGAQAFEQKTGFQAPQQGTFLDQQFQHQVSGGDDNSGWRGQDRDYWGGGAGSIDMDRTVTTADGNLANAATAQGDASIQALLDDPSGGWGGGHYDDVGGDDDDGWDTGATSYDVNQQEDFDTGGGWDYDDEEEAIGYTEPQDSGGDDSGGGGGGK